MEIKKSNKWAKLLCPKIRSAHVPAQLRKTHKNVGKPKDNQTGKFSGHKEQEQGVAAKSEPHKSRLRKVTPWANKGPASALYLLWRFIMSCDKAQTLRNGVLL